MRKLFAILLTACAAGAAFAKLPLPSDEAKAKADLAKAKTAWSDKVGAYKLCLVQDRVAAAHRKTKAADATSATPAVACQDPGPFVETSASAVAPAAAPAAAQPSASAAQPPGK